MGKSTGLVKSVQKVGNDLGQKIGAGYAEQGKSWGEISSMPSSGSGPMSNALRSGVKTGYDNYMASGGGPMLGSTAISRGVKAGYDILMANNKPATVSLSSASMLQTPSASMLQTPSASMLQTPSASGDGLAASAAGTAQQPTLTSGVQNPTADSSQFGNMTNGLGVINGLAGSRFRDNFQNGQGMQNQDGIIGGARLI